MSENIKIYKKTEEGYPKNLLQLPDAPSRLYVLGELPDPMRPAIAIVGARNCSSYGKNMAYEYARILTQRGIQVISGLARGVDAAAHAGALAAGGKTYGVMGCGVDFAILHPAGSFTMSCSSRVVFCPNSLLGHHPFPIIFHCATESSAVSPGRYLWLRQKRKVVL